MLSYAERAEFYEIDYTDRGDLAFLTALAAEARSILEVPCGVGNLSLVLCANARRYLAVDIEPNMVARLRARSDQLGTLPQLETRVGDMRVLDLEETFDLVIVQREALQLLDREDAPDAVRSLARHLSPNGKLVVDLASFESDDHPAELLPEYFSASLPDGEMRDEWTRTLPGVGTVTRRRCQHHLRGGVIRIVFHYVIERSRQEVLRDTAEIRCTVYQRAEMEGLLASAGLRVSALYGDYRETPWSPNAPRMIFVASPEPSTTAVRSPG